MRIVTGALIAREHHKGSFSLFYQANTLFFWNTVLYLVGFCSGVLAACRMTGDKALFLENCLRYFYLQRESTGFFSVLLSFCGLEAVFWLALFLVGFLPFGRLFPILLLLLKSGGNGLILTALLLCFGSKGAICVYGVSLIPDLAGALLFLVAAVSSQKLALQVQQNSKKDSDPQNLYPMVRRYNKQMLVLCVGLLAVQLIKALLGIWLLPLVAAA